MFQQHLAIFHKSRPSAGVEPSAHGSQRLMVSTEIIKNWGAENNLGGGGALAPPLIVRLSV